MIKRVAIVLAAAAVLVVPLTADATHIRPKSAFSVNVSLVPSFQSCATPDRTHGPPLAFPSCSAPDQTSSYLTIGTPDVNGSAAQSVGSFYWRAGAGTPGPPDDNVSDFDLRISDVRCRAAGPGCAVAGADYAGSVEVRLPSQITDHRNEGLPGTTQWLNIGFPVTCTTTADPSIGSLCSRHVHYFENLGYGQINDGARTVWELGQLQVWDGGGDADATTAGDNTLFAVQGLFVP